MPSQQSQISAKQIIIGVGTIVALLVGLYALDSHIESKVETKLKDSEFLAKLSSHIRPSALFDSNETILVDMGAMEHLDSIIVRTNAKQPTFTITIRPKRYLNHAPILTSADAAIYDINAKRGKRFDWQFDVDHLAGNPSYPFARFRVEVIP